MSLRTNIQARQRIADTLFLRGVLIAACAAIAVRWPMDGLLLGMVVVAVVAIGFGINDIVMALRHRHELAWWWALQLHGAASVLFGVTSVVSLGLSRAAMATLFGGWLALAGVLALAAGIVARGRGTIGIVGVTIFVASVAANVIVFADAQLSAFVLLYAGAAYATLLGITELGLGHWLRRRGAAAGLDIQEGL
jgi:uncharacterized membrane protein HdeD (DUF308 family)